MSSTCVLQIGKRWLVYIQFYQQNIQQYFQVYFFFSFDRAAARPRFVRGTGQSRRIQYIRFFGPFAISVNFKCRLCDGFRTGHAWTQQRCGGDGGNVRIYVYAFNGRLPPSNAAAGPFLFDPRPLKHKEREGEATFC